MNILDRLKQNLFEKQKENEEKTKITKVLDRPNLEFEQFIKTKRKQPTEKQKQSAKEAAVKNIDQTSRQNVSNSLSEEVKEENHYKNDENHKGLGYRLKSILGNVNANIASTPAEFAGLIGTGLAYPIAKIHSKITGYDGDVFLPMLEENPFSKLGEMTERFARDYYDIDQTENMDRTDQIINLGSMFVGPAASKSDKLLTVMLKPGIQITKDASKLTKSLQAGTQIGIPLAMNEASHAMDNSQGILYDYSNKNDEPEDKQTIENLVLSPRKNSVAENVIDVPYKEQDNEDTFTDKLKSTGKVLGEAALVGGAVLGARKSKNVQKLIKHLRDAKVEKHNATVFSDTLSLGEKVLNSVDTKNIAETAFDRGFIDEKTLNNLYRNTYSQTNNAFDTGTLYLGDNIIQTNKSPRLVLRDVQTIGAQNPREFATFNGFMNKTRQLQSKIYEYNQAHNTNYGLDDLLAKPQLMLSIQAPGNKPLAELYKEIKFLYKQVQKDGKFTEVLQNISDINNKMLDIGVQTGEFSEQFAAALKKNRDFNGLNIYLPGVLKQNAPTRLEKAARFIDKITGGDSLYKKAKVFATNKRNNNKTIIEALPWDKSFEGNYKTTIKSLLDNKIKRDLIQNLEDFQKTKIEKSINDIQDLQKTVTANNAEETAEKIGELTQKVTDEFDNVKFLGINDFSTKQVVTNENPLFKLLNKTNDEASTLEKSLNMPITNEYQNVSEAIANEFTDPSIVAIPYDNTIKYYKIDKMLGHMIQDNPQNASIFMAAMRNVTNLSKQFITGKYNPFFSPITSAYTASDQLIGLKTLNKFLPNKIKAGDINYAQSYNDAFNYKNSARQLEQIYKKLETGKLKRTPKVLKKINDLEQNIRNSDINQLKATGANIQGRYPVDVYQRKSNNFDNVDDFVINSRKSLQKLTDLIKKSHLTDNALIDASQTGLSWINYGLTSLRDAPTLGLYKALNKNFLKADGTIDANKVMNISRLLDKYTATGAIQPSQTYLGKFVQAVNDTVPYFSDMLSENLARGRQTGFGNVTKHLTNLIDANVPLQQELKSIGKGIVANDFVKAGVTLVTVPTVLASIWNHSSAENEAAYDALPDAYKSKGIVFANVVNGKPVVIPLTQSLMWLVTPLREGITDPLLRKNENAYNRSQSFSDAMKDTAKINWGISMPPLLAAGINMLGYRSPQTNELVERGATNEHAFEGLELRNLDNGSDTYYSEGIFGPKTRAVAQSLFGNVGSAVTEAIDITAARDSLSQGLEAGLNKATTTLTNLINPKVSTWSATSEVIYKKQEALKKAKLKTKTPEQTQVYDLIKQFDNSRLTPITDKIKDLRKAIRELQNTGKTSEGTELSYLMVQQNVNDYNKQIKLLQSRLVKEYETLDKVLKYNYNTTYDQFMEGIK